MTDVIFLSESKGKMLDLTRILAGPVAADVTLEIETEFVPQS